MKAIARGVTVFGLSWFVASVIQSAFYSAALTFVIVCGIGLYLVDR